ncbi:MAG TPA: flagellar hook-length control protein FliK [Rhizomicrobium sp.]|nr:flagellar hook-length control protein FliK [Rhizomicrobium sp.]
MHAIATSQSSVSGPAPVGGGLRDKDKTAKDDASFEALVTSAQQDERMETRRDDGKAESTSPSVQAHKTEQEKAGRQPDEDAGSDDTAADLRDAALATPAPDAAAEKPRAPASLDGTARTAPPETVVTTALSASEGAASVQAGAGQATQPQDQAMQAALAASTDSRASTPADATTDKKTNGVQASGHHAEQRSAAADAMPGDRPVEQAKALTDQGQDQAQRDGDSAPKPDQATQAGEARSQADAQARAETKDAGIKPLLETARAEMMPDTAPRPQSPAPATNMAVSGLVGSLDAGTPVQTSTAAAVQHVQVTAQDEAAPDLPRLAVDITARSQGGAKQFDIRLDPPELGRVEVRLSIDHDGKTSAHLTAEQPRTLDLLQRDSMLLARALRDAGLDVSQDNLNFSLRQQAQDSGHNLAGHHGQGQDQGRGSRGLPLAASRTIEATATSAAWRAPSDGRLDIRV